VCGHLGCAEAGIQIDFLPSGCNTILLALCLAFLHVPLKLSSVPGAIDLGCICFGSSASCFFQWTPISLHADGNVLVFFFLLLQFYLCFLLYSVCWCLCAVMCGSSNFRWCFLSRSGACQAALLCCTESHRAKTQLLFYRCIHHTRRQKKSHGIKIKQ
jgi:hypothetical protein